PRHLAGVAPRAPACPTPPPPAAASPVRSGGSSQGAVPAGVLALRQERAVPQPPRPQLGAHSPQEVQDLRRLEPAFHLDGLELIALLTGGGRALLLDRDLLGRLARRGGVAAAA